MKRKFTKITEPKQPPPLEIRELNEGFTGLIVTSGNSLRVTIPKGTVRICQLMAGDQLSLRIIRAGRERRETFADIEEKQQRENEKRSTRL